VTATASCGFFLSGHAETVSSGRRWPGMKQIRQQPFSGSSEVNESLLIARNLARIYADVLAEPLPRELQHLISRLQDRLEGREGARLGYRS
jgi:hypothetical protein